MTGPNDDDQGTLTLVDIELQQSPEDRKREGKSGEILYKLTYHKSGERTHKEGKITEIGPIGGSSPMDLQSLDSEKYTHYGIFRLRDRSTTTIIQDQDDRLFKVFSLGQNNTKVSYPVTIEK